MSDISANIIIRKEYDAFDVMKIICCIMIVCIHTNPLPNFFQPVYRLAVPMFFIVSSFLFFSKVMHMEKSEQTSYLKKFVRRSLQLYLFWFIALFPTSVVFFYRSWFRLGVFAGTIRFVEQFLLSYTFAIPSWYIMSSVIGTILMFYAVKSRLIGLFFTFAVCAYLLCCINSNYDSLVNCELTFELIGGGRFKPQNSFLVSLIWIYYGYSFAINKHRINAWLIPISSICLYFEYYVINRLAGIPDCQDNYFMLVPLSFVLFGLIKNWNITIRNGILLRKFSTIIFCFHHPLATIVKILLLHGGVYCRALNFFITMTISLFVCWFFLKLEKNRYFKWLKFSY